MTNAQYAIKTFDLKKSYNHNTAVTKLNLSVKQGEIFGYLGPNGAGKTTTIRLLIGLIKPTLGKIWLFGKDTKKHQTDLFNQIGYLPGDIGLYRDLSGNDYLNHFMKLHAGKYDAPKKTRLMNRFNIAYEKKIATYSKGMRQIIGIIQAFMHDPKLAILDEPTNGLDPIMQEIFYEFILEEKKAGKTIFFSSHILTEVGKVSDRIGFIKEGRLTCVKEAQEFRSNVVKKVSIVPIGNVLQCSEMLEKLDGIKKIEIDRNKIKFIYSGDILNLVKYVYDMKVKDFICEPPALEDVFYEYYNKESHD